MFTGLVSATGIVARVRRGKRGVSLTIRAPYRDLGIGESVAVDGACLTVAAKAKGTFTVLPDVSHLGLVVNRRTAEAIGSWLRRLP